MTKKNKIYELLRLQSKFVFENETYKELKEEVEFEQLKLKLDMPLNQTAKDIEQAKHYRKLIKDLLKDQKERVKNYKKQRKILIDYILN
ncbi:MAG: hypothetical protein GY737_30050 [Desulfobacteraceae bacterium]|nr:hypothetical protein [Desulfobacteraceae bacterium]